MTQAERDRLVALKKAKKKLITQREAGEELGITVHVRWDVVSPSMYKNTMW